MCFSVLHSKESHMGHKPIKKKPVTSQSFNQLSTSLDEYTEVGIFLFFT